MNRQNFGFYLDLGADLTEDLYAGVAARSEEYSDFGSSFTWKAAARFKTMGDKLALRGSASTGFRAPSLHQIYMSNIQTLISGGTVSNQGTFNNQSAVVRSLGVPKLKEENATQNTRVLLEKGEIKINKLDSLGVKGIDFLKIDVEGLEMEVLKGAEETLKNVEYIMIELNGNTEKYGSTKKDVKEYLQSLGFKVLIKTWPDIVWFKT